MAWYSIFLHLNNSFFKSGAKIRFIKENFMTYFNLILLMCSVVGIGNFFISHKTLLEKHSNFKSKVILNLFWNSYFMMCTFL